MRDDWDKRRTCESQSSDSGQDSGHETDDDCSMGGDTSSDGRESSVYASDRNSESEPDEHEYWDVCASDTDDGDVYVEADEMDDDADDGDDGGVDGEDDDDEAAKSGSAVEEEEDEDSV